MLCESCKSKPASIHITQIIAGKKKELNLCAGCASGMGIVMGTSMFQPMEALLASLFEPVEEVGKQGTRCLSCGSDMSIFQTTGRLGCPMCYQVFSAELMPFIRKIQRGHTHTGSRPNTHNVPSPQNDQNKEELRRAREQMAHAIENEEFEQAAKLRDEIRALESAIKEKERTDHAGMA